MQSDILPVAATALETASVITPATAPARGARSMFRRENIRITISPLRSILPVAPATAADSFLVLPGVAFADRFAIAAAFMEDESGDRAPVVLDEVDQVS